jgi:Domain of unknown function (DUF4328)
MNPLKNNAQRANAVNIVFIILLVITLVTIVSDFMQANLLNSFKSGFQDADAATANDTRVYALNIGNLVVNICGIVFFILWFRRAYYNLHLTQEVNLLYTEGWAAGAWFVPFINLVRPYQIMNEIWNKTQGATKNLLSFKNSSLVGWWWAVYLISNIISNIANRAFNDDSTIDTLLTGTYVQIFSNCIEVCSIIITIILVKKTAAIEAKLYGSYEPVEEGQEDLLGIL